MPPEPSNESSENISRFEKLLVALARATIDYAVVGGVARHPERLPAGHGGC